MKVIDNFLPLDIFTNLSEQINSPFFDWYFNNKIVVRNEQTLDDFQFTHTFYMDHIIRSNYSIVKPLIDKINPLALVRIKANLTVKQSKIIEHGYHTDFSKDEIEDVDKVVKAAVFYINNNDGYTKFEESGEIVESVANRILIFNSHIRHTGTNCTNSKNRIVININFI